MATDPIDDILSNRGNREQWGAILSNLANMIASIPEQRLRQQELAERVEDRAAMREVQRGELDIRRQEVGLKQQALKSQQVVSALAAKYIKPDGTIDRGLIGALAQGGVPVEMIQHYGKIADDLEASAKRKNDANAQDLADTADAILRSEKGKAPSPDALALGLAWAKRQHGELTDEQLQPLYEAMASGDPEQIKRRLTQVRAQFDRGGKYKTDENEKPIVIGKGGALVKPTGEVIYQGPEAETEAKVGSFEDYVTRTYGANPTPAQVLAARKAYGQADDRPAVSVRLPSGMTPSQELNATRQLRNDYEKEAKSARTINQQLAQMRSSMEAVRKGSAPAGSQGVLVTFQKILDPTSVVRESEYARSAAGLSLIGRLEGTWERIKGGGAGVSVKDLEQFVALSEQFAKNQNAFAAQSKAQIDAIAKQYGLKPENITKDFAEPTEAPAPKPRHTFSVAEVQAIAQQQGMTYAAVKAELERQGQIVK